MPLACSRTDLSGSPPRISFPRPYNAAVDLVDRHIHEGRGARLAYHDDFGSVTYAELHDRVNRAGNLLRALGVQPEQRVMLVMLDTVDFVAMFLGAIKLGAVPVPVNTLLSPADYAHLLADSRARLVCVSDALLPKLHAARAALPAIPVVVARSPQGGDSEGLPLLTPLLAQSAPHLSAAATTADDVAFWLYSSGSTGAPKGAMHLHAHLMRTAVLYGQGVLGIDENDVFFSAAKLFFAYGLGNSLTCPLAVGASAILRAERATSAAVLHVITAQRPTLFFGVPTLFAAMLADEKAAAPGSQAVDFSSLRASVSAGEALPRHIGEGWRARTGSDIYDGIGSTEMLHIFLSNRPGALRYGTTGQPVPGYTLKLVDDAGAPVPDGEEGSLFVDGPTAAIGYFGNRERSLATFLGPWTRTGDRYLRDADGYYTYCGRSDDMLKVGGRWVSPFEVESALAAHPAVLEAAVVGKADAEGLIKAQAFVVLKNQHLDPRDAALTAELQAFVKERIAPYKCPRWIEFVAELPKTATGKIQRFRLRG